MENNTITKSELYILMVEDDPIPATMHGMALKKLGHRFDHAKTGEESLSMIKNGYDVILMDIGLPGISGIDSATEIRRLEDKANPIPIIAVTGYTDEDVKERCLSAGINEITRKPLAIGELEKLLNKVLQIHLSKK